MQRALGITSIYVTHDQLEAMTLADLLVVMNAGRVEQIGNPLDIYESRPSTFVASFIGAPPMNLLPVTPGENGFAFGDGSAVGAALGLDNAATFGFRPEDADVAFGPELPPGGFALEAEVEAVEPVGAESFLSARRRAIAPSSAFRAVRWLSRATACVSSSEAEKLHWFNAGGKRLQAAATAGA